MPLLLFILILCCLIASFLIPWWRTDAIKKELEEKNRLLNEEKRQFEKEILKEKKELKKIKKQSEKDIVELKKKSRLIESDIKKLETERKNLENLNSVLKRSIQGYGNEYIEPISVIYDELISKYGYTQAAKNLKDIKSLLKGMRKKGKVVSFLADSISASEEDLTKILLLSMDSLCSLYLSEVKVSNVGTLQQKVRDAAVLIEGAFKNRVKFTQEYIDARIKEISLMSAMEYAKELDREQQRIIKEKIREEQKVQREIEKALREAEAKEKALQKQIDIAKAKELEAGENEEKRRVLEIKIEELEQQLQLARDSGQRALSMAQQTKRGYVYVISNEGSFGPGVFKIGMTRRLEPLDRVRELGDASVPFSFDVHAMIYSEDAPKLETTLHKHFLMDQVNKVNYRKEFFRTDLHSIKEVVDGFGLECHWTETAKAKEYRETLAIEKTIAHNPVAREAWKKRQLVLDSPLSHFEEWNEVENT